VQEIAVVIRKFASGVSMEVLAERYGVGLITIDRAVRRQTKISRTLDLSPEITTAVQARLSYKKSPRGAANNRTKLSEEKVREIKKLLASGSYTHKQIAQIMGTRRSTVTGINQGRSWQWLDKPVPQISDTQPALIKSSPITKPLYSVVEAAAIVGYDRDSLLAYLKKKKIIGTRYEGHWYFTEQQLQSLRERREAILREKLPIEKVVAIKRLLAEGKLTQLEIARKLSVTLSIVKAIKRGHTWRSVVI
jgi:DNA-binding CsgD family transcriptional regulator